MLSYNVTKYDKEEMREIYINTAEECWRQISEWAECELSDITGRVLCHLSASWDNMLGHLQAVSRYIGINSNKYNGHNGYDGILEYYSGEHEVRWSYGLP